jgi:hypothetical protein
MTRALVHTTPQQQAQKRKRTAARKAVDRLSKVSSAQSQNRFELLTEIMQEYIGRRFDRVAGSLTAEDCRQVIIAQTDDSNLAARYSSIISDCQAARYAPVQPNVDSATIDEVIELIRNIEKKSKSKL